MMVTAIEARNVANANANAPRFEPISLYAGHSRVAFLGRAFDRVDFETGDNATRKAILRGRMRSRRIVTKASDVFKCAVTGAHLLLNIVGCAVLVSKNGSVTILGPHALDDSTIT